MTTPPITTREKSLDWFFGKSKFEKEKLKDKHYPDNFIPYSEQWGFAFTFGQIEKMYLKEIK